MTDRVDRYRHLRRQVVCENRHFQVCFDVVTAPDEGGTIDDFLIVRPKTQSAGLIVGVCVLPVVEGRIGLMRGFRHQLDQEVWQAPGGFVEPGEDPAVTALRELEEETDLTCNSTDIHPLGSFFPDAGLIEGAVALYAANPCRVQSGDRGRSREVGTGQIELFTATELRCLLVEENSIGGSTLVAGFRYLAVSDISGLTRMSADADTPGGCR